MAFWTALPEALLLVTALSLDAFAASFAYGANRIQVPQRSLLLIDVICASLLLAGLLAGQLISPLLPAAATRFVCFAILFLLGLVRLCDSTVKALIQKYNHIEKNYRFSMFKLRFILSIYADPPQADEDSSQVLSPGEAVSLAVALSLDGLAVGFGTGFSDVGWLPIVAAALLVNYLSMLLGCGLGRVLAAKAQLNLSWLSGVLLMILAILKL